MHNLPYSKHINIISLNTRISQSDNLWHSNYSIHTTYNRCPFWSNLRCRKTTQQPINCSQMPSDQISKHLNSLLGSIYELKQKLSTPLNPETVGRSTSFAYLFSKLVLTMGLAPHVAAHKISRLVLAGYSANLWKIKSVEIRSLLSVIY